MLCERTKVFVTQIFCSDSAEWSELCWLLIDCPGAAARPECSAPENKFQGWRLKWTQEGFHSPGQSGMGCSGKLLEGRGSSRGWDRNSWILGWRNTNLWVLDQESFVETLVLHLWVQNLLKEASGGAQTLQESRTLPWNLEFGISMKAQESGNQLKPSGLQRATSCSSQHHCNSPKWFGKSFF